LGAQPVAEYLTHKALLKKQHEKYMGFNLNNHKRKVNAL